MTREEAVDVVWEVYDTYFIQRPKATTYTCEGLYDYLQILLPTEDERQDLYEALGIETCVQCRAEQGLPKDFCPWCAACTLVFDTQEAP